MEKQQSKVSYYAKFVRRKYIVAVQWLFSYKINFFLFLLAFSLEISFTFLFWKILFLNENTLNGWTFKDVFGLMLFMYFFWVIRSIFESGLRRSFRLIRTGGFDYFLLFPLHPLMNALFYKVTITSFLSNLCVFLFLFLSYLLSFSVSFSTLVIAFLFGFFGNIIIILFFFILRCFSFWLKENKFLLILENGTHLFNKYPLTITNKFFQFTYTFIFPLIFVVTIPAEILRGNFSFVWILYEIGMLIALALLAAFVWKKGLEHYESGMG
ncbi:MAG: ABC-2 family transporter protein [Candidatus Woesearchaeota archaeon]|nr:ABC-2 family transporter protein [Nanoarchaeota archaeon]USN44108.1 MAG: ABC-2 family transporter protein [Candidatus Woesearchaeota archaeon]